VQQTDHSRPLKPRDRAIGQRGSAGHALRLAGQGSFAKEVAGPQNGHHSFLALLRDDRELDLTFLDIKDRVGRVALCEDFAVLPVVQQSLPLIGSG